MTPPTWPAGEFVSEPNSTPARRAELIADLESFPSRLAISLAAIGDGTLELKYRNWTVRQIVHHLADSHVNCFVRLRLTLTEENPTIKPYDESRWSELIDNRTMDISPSLEILNAVHERMVAVFRAMTPKQFSRTYVHPEYKKTVALDEMLGLYAHHGRHHLAQIEWVKANRMS